MSPDLDPKALPNLSPSPPDQPQPQHCAEGRLAFSPVGWVPLPTPLPLRPSFLGAWNSYSTSLPHAELSDSLMMSVPPWQLDSSSLRTGAFLCIFWNPSLSERRLITNSCHLTGIFGKVFLHRCPWCCYHPATQVETAAENSCKDPRFIVERKVKKKAKGWDNKL